MSVVMLGLLGAFALILIVLAVARRQPGSRRRDGADAASWYTGSEASGYSVDSSSSCDSGSTDGGSCDGGGSH